jgi:hypothetical protein
MSFKKIYVSPAYGNIILSKNKFREMTEELCGDLR